MYALINDGIADLLQSHTLADLLDPAWVLEHGGPATREAGAAAVHDGFGCNPNRRREIRKRAN
jgi:hypothetical protein